MRVLSPRDRDDVSGMIEYIPPTQDDLNSIYYVVSEMILGDRCEEIELSSWVL